MYNEHFGLEHSPFRITPDTRLFYTGGGRGDVLDALVYAITSGEGIIKVTGEVGTGKTMLCRMLESRLPGNVDLVYLANPSLSPDDIVQAIALELGVAGDGASSRIEFVFQLQQILVDRHADNRRVVVLVEEAQSMPLATLEEIRLLSNLETKREKLLQIVLFGQPELDEKLALPEIRQLRERITHSFKLEPLAPKEIRDYVNFRLRSSGYRGRDAFTADACRAISRASEGLTRRVNILADKAMLAAYTDDTHDVARRHVKVAIKDSNFPIAKSFKLNRRWATAALVVVAGALGFAAAKWVPSPHQVTELASSSSPGTEPALRSAVASASDSEASALSGSGRDEVASNSTSSSQSVVTPAPSSAPAEPTDVVVPGASAMQSATTTSANDQAAQATAQRDSATTTPANGQTTQPTAQRASATTTPANGQTTQATAQRDSTTTTPANGQTTQATAQRDSTTTTPANDQTTQALAQRDATTTVPEQPATIRAAEVVSVSDAKSALPDNKSAPTLKLAAASPSSATLPRPSLGPAVSPQEPTPKTPAAASAPAAESSVASAPGTVSASEPPSEALPVVESDSVAAPIEDKRDLLEQRLDATLAWIDASDPGSFTIQVLATVATERSSLLRFLDRQRLRGDLQRVFVYETRIGGRPWYSVVFGRFESFSAARKELKALPRDLARHGPFIRNIRDLSVRG